MRSSSMSNVTTELREPPLQRTRARGKVRTWLISLAVTTLCAAGIWYGIIQPRLQKDQAATHPRAASFNQAMPVGVATVNQGDLQIILRGLGTVNPLATVTVRAHGFGITCSFSIQGACARHGSRSWAPGRFGEAGRRSGWWRSRSVRTSRPGPPVHPGSTAPGGCRASSTPAARSRR